MYKNRIRRANIVLNIVFVGPRMFKKRMRRANMRMIKNVEGYLCSGHLKTIMLTVWYIRMFKNSRVICVLVFGKQIMLTVWYLAEHAQ